MVGRDAGNTLVIHHDSVSHHHCEILVNGAEVIVRDLGSKNGTLVDGIRLLSSQAQLNHGKVVQFGSVKARLDLGDDQDETDTSMTAVHLFERYQAAGRTGDKAGAEKKPPAMILGSDEDDSNQTVMLTPAKPAASPAAPLEIEPTDLPGQKRGRKIILGIAILAILALLLILVFR